MRIDDTHDLSGDGRVMFGGAGRADDRHLFELPASEQIDGFAAPACVFDKSLLNCCRGEIPCHRRFQPTLRQVPKRKDRPIFLGQSLRDCKPEPGAAGFA